MTAPSELLKAPRPFRKHDVVENLYRHVLDLESMAEVVRGLSYTLLML
jgi:hypothetical protein